MSDIEEVVEVNKNKQPEWWKTEDNATASSSIAIEDEVILKASDCV